MASLNIFYRYYSEKFSYEMSESIFFLILMGGLLVILISCMVFLSLFQNAMRMSMSTFFLRAAKLWNSLLAEWFLLTYDLNIFKSRVNRHLLFLVSFYTAFLYASLLCPQFFCNFIFCKGCQSLWGVKPNSTLKLLMTKRNVYRDWIY